MAHCTETFDLLVEEPRGAAFGRSYPCSGRFCTFLACLGPSH